VNVIVTSERQPAVPPARAGECWSCPHGQPGRPAAYLWTAALSGNEIPLCAGCCAYWRKTARDEPDLRPSRIRLLA
jgi:hypothetical protein